MILTTCAACAAPLAHDAPLCRRCCTRYCSPKCRDTHWRGGHTPAAQRDLGESDDLTLRMKEKYAKALYKDDGSTLDDLREAVATLEEIERIARRVFGGAHPTTALIEVSVGESRAALRAREAPPESS